jgi:excisionase family DNA binding protein
MEFTFGDLITLDEAAKLLDIGKITLLRAVQANELEASKIGHSYRTTKKALQEYVNRKTIKVEEVKQ